MGTDNTMKSFIDVLNDEYFLGTKMTMKVKNVKGIVIKENGQMICIECDSRRSCC